MSQSPFHRVASSAIAIVVATTALVAGGSGSAQAATTYNWQLSDPMEGTAADRFFFETDSNYAEGHIETASGTRFHARSGTQAAILRNERGAAGSWVSVGRKVIISPRYYHFQTTCHFMAWAYGSGTATYNIEVIDPSNWQYISVKRVTQPVAWTWSKISTSEFTVSYPNVILRVSYLFPSYGSAVFVDDFGLSCTYH